MINEAVEGMADGSVYDPGTLIAKLDALRAADATLGITGLHVFSFNQVAATEAWLRAARTKEVLDG